MFADLFSSAIEAVFPTAHAEEQQAADYSQVASAGSDEKDGAEDAEDSTESPEEPEEEEEEEEPEDVSPR